MTHERRTHSKRSTAATAATAAMLTLIAGSMTAPVAVAQQSTQYPATAAAVNTSATPGFYQLHGSGTTNPSKLIWWAMDLLEERSRAFLKMTYRSVGSGTGEADWKSAVGAGDFMSTDYSLDGSGTTYGTTPFLQLPFQIGAVSVFHTVPGYGPGELKISACTLAKIYTGAITSWAHADIKTDTGVTFPAGTDMHVAFRLDGSSSTYGLRGYLNATCPSVYLGGYVGGNSFGTTTTGGLTALTNANLHHSAQGSDGVRKEIAKRTYSIGYLDAGHGHADDLAEFALSNANNEWVVTKSGSPAGRISADIPAVVTSDIVTAFNTASYTGDLRSINLFNKVGPNIWPICAFTFLHVRTTYTDPNTAALVKAFVQFILSAEVQAKVSTFDFFPLAASFNAAVLSAANSGIATAGATNLWAFPTIEASSVTGYDATQTMGDNTFSIKRQAYIDYALELVQGDISDLEVSVAAIQSTPGSSQKSLNPVTALAAVDFVIAFIAIIIASVALRRVGSAGKYKTGVSNYVVGP